MAKSAKELAIAAVMKATGESREEVLSKNPQLAEVSAAAERPRRGIGSTVQRPVPAGVPDPWA